MSYLSSDEKISETLELYVETPVIRPSVTRTQPKGRGPSLNYVKQSNFLNLESAKKSLEQEQTFPFVGGRGTNQSIIGNERRFQCAFKGCPKRAHILLHSHNLTCTTFISDNEHCHQAKFTRTGIHPAVKPMIDQLFDDGVIKPNAIKKALDNRPDFNPTLHIFSSNQLSNHLKQL